MAIEIKLYDTIGGWGITALALAEQIPSDAQAVTVRINSPGGDVADGLAMYHYLKDHPARITTVVDGYAASAASVVMLAGDEVRVHRSSIVMLHNPWTVAVGNADELRHTADVLDVHGKALLDIYKAKTGMDEADIADLMDGETWMRGEAAVEYGLADSLIEDEQEPQERAAAHVAFAAMIENIKEGNELMSRQYTRKEIEAERDGLKAEVGTLTARVTELETASVAELATVQESLATAQADLTARDETITGLTDQVATLQAGTEGLTQQVEDLTGKLASETERAEAAVTALARNPATADAVMTSAASAQKVTVDAEADAAEQAAAEADVVEDRDLWEEYFALKDPKARSRFWDANADAMQTAQKDIGSDEG